MADIHAAMDPQEEHIIKLLFLVAHRELAELDVGKPAPDVIQLGKLADPRVGPFQPLISRKLAYFDHFLAKRGVFYKDFFCGVGNSYKSPSSSADHGQFQQDAGAVPCL